MTQSPQTRMDDLTVERVLRVVEAIPEGNVASYGDVGAIAGVGPRPVGRILSVWGASVPWWRVTNANGDHPLMAEALPHWQREGIAVKPNGRGCRINDHRVDVDQLAEECAPALSGVKPLLRELRSSIAGRDLDRAQLEAEIYDEDGLPRST